MKYREGHVTIVIEQGDITDANVEAIVNAANNVLYMGAGVAGSIKRKGGQEIETEAVQKGPIPIGSATLTSAGSLKARYVVHAAVMGIDLITDEEKIRSATLAALDLAEQNSIKSIALPALGTGVGGFPLNEAARIMFSTIKEHLQGGKSTIDKIVFVLFGYEAYNEFRIRADKDFEKANV